MRGNGRPTLRRWLRRGAGWGFVVVGLAGLVLPVLQGVLFLGVGLYLLADDSPWARRAIARLRRRFPRHAQTLDRAEARARAWIARHAGRAGDDFRDRRF
ncbi:MAG: hypothetical protein HY521_07095 [Proteobacteria bacterium]|nr:hypothetical protein [Pseudomonadota bacterium]